MTHLVLDPRLDGECHINVWSRGVTDLGRLLSNFSRTPFVHPRFGPFESMEGYWYWLASGCQYEELREVWGFLAKQMGRRYDKVLVGNFEELICEGIYHKVLQTPGLAQRLTHSTLPLYHYYWFGNLENGKYKIVTPSSGHFQMEYLEDLRFHLRHLEGIKVYTF